MIKDKKTSYSSRSKKVKSLSRKTRKWRRVHYYLGLSIALFLFISASTGLLLGYKKELSILQPPTQKGVSTHLNNWLPLDEIAIQANNAVNSRNGLIIDRMDIRPDKGVVKVTYKPGYWEVQVDGTTGEVLSVAKRHSDLIEQIHDGSIISDSFKLISMNILGLGILILIFSGIWLWYGPKIIRKFKHI
ncbi:MAG: PepSY domain-containing protein [Candidatus Cyclobacteriaceae bacterium M2_1C_046]